MEEVQLVLGAGAHTLMGARAVLPRVSQSGNQRGHVAKRTRSWPVTAALTLRRARTLFDCWSCARARSDKFHEPNADVR